MHISCTPVHQQWSGLRHTNETQRTNSINDTATFRLSSKPFLAVRYSSACHLSMRTFWPVRAFFPVERTWCLTIVSVHIAREARQWCLKCTLQTVRQWKLASYSGTRQMQPHALPRLQSVVYGYSLTRYFRLTHNQEAVNGSLLHKLSLTVTSLLPTRRKQNKSDWLLQLKSLRAFIAILNYTSASAHATPKYLTSVRQKLVFVINKIVPWTLF